ncbi:SpoIIE family protein phosphatase/ATP-binding protein [Streptomyces marispadix]|uniref:SpoIIE family protein phosphatase n=1 Tax=Streptomyces marispadix TaxID=2922868 RepID=A0ABS9SYG7_9ACTN|nr:SpoIIE family protein phosphatase/ATP-binding protein [Streptomyces marispadix]MCH6161313.1 SpoIIE family protein phosphatase [Streptomyces marispadix]
MAGPLTRLRALAAPLLPDRRLRRPRLGEGSVAGQVFVLQVAVVLLLVVAAVAALVLQVRRDSTDAAGDRSLAVAETLANSPGTLSGLRSPDPTARLQGPAEAARKRTGVDFVVVMNTKGVRYTHPARDRIGKKFVGTIGPALRGQVHRETVEGTIGEIVQVVVPVRNSDGRIVGLVSAGIKVDKVGRVVDRQLPLLLGAAAVALALATGGTALVSRRLRRQTHGLGTLEMTRMYEHHDAVLHSVHEGVLIVSGEGRLLLANDEASRLLDLPPDAQGRHVTELGLEAPMRGLLHPGRVATDEVLRSGDRLLAVNNRSTDRNGGPPGWVATLRDTTELRLLSTRVESARKRLELLYEAGGGIGTTLDVTRTAEELAQVPVPRFADFVTVDLAEPVLRGDEPSPNGSEPVMRRTAVHGVRDDQPLYPLGRSIAFASRSPQARSFESGRAVLEPRLSESPGWRAQDPERTDRVLEFGIHSLIAAPLRARGVLLGVVNFWRSEKPEPFEDDDLSLASELAARAAVSIDNARRFTREHGMAVALQRSLLPRALPEQSAVEVASRYLPAQAGVGGDWFDVIPLPGARVALAVGDVVGHGLHAAATMGRLRTAVHNFSALDLPPDELLGHLDELAARVDQDAIEAGDETAITGATCLYAVYDPASRTCVMARAGHPTPALARPDGTVEFPEIPSGLPLGIGGLPFESVELKLEEGSRLVLYTDGLVERRDKDIDTGLELLREAVAHAGQSPEESCDAVLDALMPDRQGDDIALLVARTRGLGSGQVAEWEVDSDPSAVAGVRAEVTAQLARWGLEEQDFVTELILSELITNAIRHATGPIRVRLLHDRALICEVSDRSSTSPHLRHAAATDEGGRGLFLVAQFADRWGTRYTKDGKVIWTEQSLASGVL